jgi:hypothetical protein
MCCLKHFQPNIQTKKSIMNTNSKLKALEASLSSALTVVGSILSDGDDTDNELESGAAGSGRFRQRVGHATADLVSEAAQRASRRARRENTVESHTAAGDLHQHAGREMKKAGEPERADEHFQKASAHFGIAKTLQGCSMEASAGRSVVEHPVGSDPDANDKSQYDDERRQNLENSGPFASPNPETGDVKCPLCQHTFTHSKSVSGKNIAEIVCPRCSGAFRLDTGRSIGTPSEE